MKILINTISTKKITGGAFQIAQNFLLISYCWGTIFLVK
ncbi:hypothetical protein HMPREF1212_01791 [Parabacteroides sp. HGS0025]|nr:hypothetical protein HMPREF1212_01791 [Parabacteroides sp. HGS0025]